MKRRHFLKHSSAGLLTILGAQEAQQKNVPKLAFSTLGCPEWSFEKILESAVQNGYQGIELRGIQKDMDLTVSPLFNSPSNIQNTLKLCKKLVSLLLIWVHQPIYIGQMQQNEKAIWTRQRDLSIWRLL
jgi:hypothetical protein